MRFTVSNLADTKMDQRQLREDLASAIVDSYLSNPVDLAARGPAGLHVRYLPPGRVADLYHLYVAAMHATSEPTAGAWIFRQVWRSEWSQALRFRKASTHAM